MTPEERKEKQRIRMLEYYHNNKKAINRRVVAKRKADKLKELNVVVKINQKNITKKEIMSLIGVTALVLDKILKDKKYSAPPKREPLSDDEIVALWANKSPANEFECVRLVEKAHGIGGGE